MTDERMNGLLVAESKLSRSFWAAVVGVVGSLLWTLSVTGGSADAGSGMRQATVVVLLLQLGFYVWYAISAGAAAKILGDPAWKYIVWILAAPFLAQIPIPFVSTAIGASPLAIKFLLGGQLQEAIRREGMAALHEPIG